MKSNLEAVVPGLAELRSRERLTRAFGFAGVSHSVCGVELLPLTPMHRLTLQLLQNCFVSSTKDPLEGDVFGFLWVLSPYYSRRLTLASRVRQFFLRRRVRRLERIELRVAVSLIREYIVAQLQDLPESAADGDDSSVDQSPWVHWAAPDASWWLNVHGGFTLETYFSTPYVVLQQLYRGWRVNHPAIRYERDGSTTVEEPSFINESDRLVGAWQRQYRDAVAEVMRSQTHRIE